MKRGIFMTTLDVSVKKSRLKHPPGLYLLFLTEMWERFSYYGLRSLLMLYLTVSFVQGGLGYSVSSGAFIYAVYTGFTYFTPIIGGWLADNFLGQKKAIIIGAIIMAIGNFALFADGSRIGLYIGLALLIVGNGFFKPNISTVVGQLYDKEDKRKDSAFTIFYMGINLGSLIAPLICGLLAEDIFAKTANGAIIHYGFKYGFLAAAIGMVLGAIIFVTFSPKYLAHVGGLNKEVNKTNEYKKTNANKPLTKQEKRRIGAILVLAAFVIFFWTGFEQAGSSLTIFTQKLTNREIGGMTVPVAWFQSCNPVFVLILSPILAKLWIKLANREKGDLSVPVKMAMGMIILGIGFLFMVGAVLSIGGAENPVAKASMWWIVLTYFCNTVGELCLSPIGLSMVSKLAPIKYASLLMGIWMAASGIANLSAGLIASRLEAFGPLEIFGGISAVCITLGVVLLLLSKKISKLME
ncbi:POT family proton-dependent oligopeptide transporter [Clostridium moniliforme]|uniref:POT family proton-dependent oligopeptide transporter n=1 Tax=Clostridium moniliforme TaxID=39489 RepID=A0ABS4EXU5_9CLOT|nr:POT family proton-dependent oligopeptide transporter [Clostridium moniliforme]